MYVCMHTHIYDTNKTSGNTLEISYAKEFKQFCKSIVCFARKLANRGTMINWGRAFLFHR